MAKKKPRTEPEALELPPVGVDSHAHLDMDDFDEDRDEIFQRAADAGVSHIVNVFLGPDGYDANSPLFKDRPNVSFILGVHPNDADQLTDDALNRMRAQFQAEPRLKAVGEIGLDHYWDRVPRDVQRDAFIRQLHLARDLKMPVVIHCRDAEADTLDVLRQEKFTDYPLLWHCFGGGLELAADIVDNGWHISIPGPVTFKKTDDLQAAVARIPFDRLLIETDCPYLAPEPWRGKRNHPALAAFTAQRIAQIKGRSLNDIWQITGDNARRFFGLE